MNLWAKEAEHVITKTHDLAKDAMKAPDVLDGETLKTWVNASVWTFLILNFVSLLLYLGALALPALKKAYLTFQAIQRERALQKIKMKEATKVAVAKPQAAGVAVSPEKTSPAPSDSQSPEVIAAMAAAAAMTLPSGDITSPANPTTDSAAALSTNEIQEVLDIPQDLGVEKTEIIVPPTEITETTTEIPADNNTSSLDAGASSADADEANGAGIEEVYEAPPPPEPLAASVEEIFEPPPPVEPLPTSESLSTAEPPPPPAEAPPPVEPAVEAPPPVQSLEPPPEPVVTQEAFGGETTVVLDVNTLVPPSTDEASLPAPAKSDETESVTTTDQAASALAAIEKNIEGDLDMAPTEELAIFDSSALDKILQEDEKT